MIQWQPRSNATGPAGRTSRCERVLFKITGAADGLLSVSSSLCFITVNHQPAINLCKYKHCPFSWITAPHARAGVRLRSRRQITSFAITPPPRPWTRVHPHVGANDTAGRCWWSMSRQGWWSEDDVVMLECDRQVLLARADCPQARQCRHNIELFYSATSPNAKKGL